jgi:hypothetical protein
MAGILTAEDAAANRILPLVEKVEVAEPIDQHKDLEVCVHIGEAVQPPSLSYAIVDGGKIRCS